VTGTKEGEQLGKEARERWSAERQDVETCASMKKSEYGKPLFFSFLLAFTGLNGE